ncbi:MAG: dihydroneopterin aldolase [Alphaproteobacteria bacterium]
MSPVPPETDQSAGGPRSLPLPDPAKPALGIRHVFVRNLVIPALIGIFSHEKERPQPLRVCVDLAVPDPGTAGHAGIADLVRYDDVVALVRNSVDRGHVSLMETLAERIAGACLEDKRVLAVRVSLEKLDAIPEAEAVGIAIERHQSEYSATL